MIRSLIQSLAIMFLPSLANACEFYRFECFPELGKITFELFETDMCREVGNPSESVKNDLSKKYNIYVKQKNDTQHSCSFYEDTVTVKLTGDYSTKKKVSLLINEYAYINDVIFGWGVMPGSYTPNKITLYRVAPHRFSLGVTGSYQLANKNGASSMREFAVWSEAPIFESDISKKVVQLNEEK